jgi:hypothetical protein
MFDRRVFLMSAASAAALGGSGLGFAGRAAAGQAQPAASPAVAALNALTSSCPIPKR